MKQPTEADIEAAKAYLRQRLECEHAMTTLLENAMKEAAEKIVDICYSAGVNPQSFRYSDLPVRVQFDIDEVIQRLQEAIDDYFLTLAIADHEENRDKILPFILGENHGMTFAERLENYCGKYRDELMVLVGAGLFLGIAKSALVKSIGENLKHPYANQLLSDGIEVPLTYGRGEVKFDVYSSFRADQIWHRKRMDATLGTKNGSRRRNWLDCAAGQFISLPSM